MLFQTVSRLPFRTCFSRNFFRTHLIFEESDNRATQCASHKSLRLIRVVEESDLQGNGADSQINGLLHGSCCPVPHVQARTVFP